MQDFCMRHQVTWHASTTALYASPSHIGRTSEEQSRSSLYGAPSHFACIHNSFVWSTKSIGMHPSQLCMRHQVILASPRRSRVARWPGRGSGGPWTAHCLRAAASCTYPQGDKHNTTMRRGERGPWVPCLFSRAYLLFSRGRLAQQPPPPRQGADPAPLGARDEGEDGEAHGDGGDREPHHEAPLQATCNGQVTAGSADVPTLCQSHRWPLPWHTKTWHPDGWHTGSTARRRRGEWIR
jgi:hypothetical protein